MNIARRQFCKIAMALPVGALSTQVSCMNIKNETVNTDETNKDYLSYGRDKEYKEFNIIDPGLKIVKIETFTVRKVGVVRVTTDNGLVGYGQISPHDAYFTTLILHDKVAKRFLGKDAAYIDQLVDQTIDSNYKFPGTYVCRALAGIETAIWDLYGKIKNKPVVELLGGNVCEIPVYGSSMSRTITPKNEASRMVKLKNELGYNAFKLRVGKKNGRDEDEWVGRSEELIPTVRKALGNDVDLMVDANSCYTPPKAIELGKILEDNNYSFFEEPCPYWELEWTKEVTRNISVPVAGGEQDNDLAQWRRMIDMNIVDIVQPDICYIGGITRAYRVARMAEKAGKLIIPHTSNWSMVSIFSLHLLGAFSNRKYLEYTIDGTTELAETSSSMYLPQIKVIDGKVKIPDGPGWGVEFSQKWLETADYRKSEYLD